jgi:outer membrane protein TolC
MLPSLMFAQSLKSLLEYAHQNNNLVKSYTLGKESKAKSVEARESSYYPTVDIGANYKNLSDLSPIQIRDTYTAYAKASLDIYDGGSKSALLKQSKDELASSGHDEAGFKKSLSMLIVKDFYELKGVEATLRARDDAKKSIEEQLKRTEAFVAARLATQDDVDRLSSKRQMSMR